MLATLALSLLAATSAPGHRAPAASPAPANLAPRARATASFTAANALLMAVNDGRLPATASPLGCWHTWGGRSDPVTLSYEWAQPVVLSAAEVVW